MVSSAVEAPAIRTYPHFGSGGRHRVRGRRDRHELEDAPPEELQDVQHGRQVGHPRPEQPAKQHHGRRARVGTGYPGKREHRGPQQRADHDGGQRGSQRQLRRPRTARLQHEDRAGEAEQAYPEVAPQPELVEQSERLRNRLGERSPHLGAAVTGNSDEGALAGIGGVGRRGHSSLPTPELPGQVQTVGGTGSHPLSPVSPSSREFSSANSNHSRTTRNEPGRRLDEQPGCGLDRGDVQCHPERVLVSRQRPVPTSRVGGWMSSPAAG